MTTHVLKLAAFVAPLFLFAGSCSGGQDQTRDQPTEHQLASAIAQDRAKHPGVAGADSHRNHVNHLPPQLESKVEAVIATLRASGYEVARGYWKTFDIDQCTFAIQVLGNCLGNNPAAPYVLPIVPPWRDEYVDRSAHLQLGPVQEGFVSTYRLSEREAIVVMAKLPPPGAYFGLQSYVFTRNGTFNLADDAYVKLEENSPDMLPLMFGTAPDPSRMMLFASIGNSINNVVIANANHPAGAPAWDQERVMIVTPDDAMREAVTVALQAGAGIPGDQVFVEPVAPWASSGGGLVKLGPQRDADDIFTLVRYAMPDPEAETRAREWREDLPLAVLRVRDMTATRALRPYDVPVYEKRSAESEQALAPALDALTVAVMKNWGKSAVCVKPFIVPYLDIDLIGQDCLKRPMNCIGDTMDTDTYRISPGFTIDPPGIMVAVVGTLATETRNATYVSVGINRFDVLEAVKNYSQRDLINTATGLLQDRPDLKDDAGKLYAFYLSRRCPAATGAKCIEVSEDDVPSGEVIKIMQRNYIKPGTQRGADPGTPDDLSTPDVRENEGNETLLRPRLLWRELPACPS